MGIRVATLVLLLLAAPDDPAQMMRVAWASQYEWKEDKVESATIDFRYRHTWGDNGQNAREGQGQIVVVGDVIVRRHYPDAQDDDARRELNEHVDWVLARFIRRPFEQVFQDAKFTGPEKSAYDQMKIGLGDRAWYLKDDRIVAEERDFGDQGKPLIVRVDCRVTDLGGGYAIVGETISYTRRMDSAKVIVERGLTTRSEADRPAPASYTFERKTPKDKESFTIDFSSVRFDLPDPVTLNAAARDLLKEAWGHRFVLPENIIIQGEFTRQVDRDLDRARWRNDVRGSFQVYGMNDVQVTIDEGREETQKTCQADIRAIFGILKSTPFDEEFKGCGFELEAQGAESIVRVYGYPKALAYRIADGHIVGHYQRVLSESDWWVYKTKSAGEGRFQIERMRREIEGKKIDLEFDYQRVRGQTIPKKVGVVAIAPTMRGDLVVGVAEYTFKRTKVSLPDE